jgi:2-polyprenyl-3-methyl-5-hydroxy-6-metoxy-1,4-benzoquinol methylase
VLGQPGRLPFTAEELTGMAAAPLLQAAALAGGQTQGWAAQSEPALSAQGNASGSAAAGFIRFALPHLGELAERLAAPGARMLDVGTGVGALAIGFAAAFPQLYVTGIDVLARAMDIARANLAASPVASRIDLRLQDVADLTDQACYDLAWIPAPFVPEPAFTTGVARTVTALRPGGLIMIGHGKFDGGELENAITRFKTVTYGGTALDGPSAAKLLSEHALHAVQTVPTPPGAPGVTIGLR